MVTDILGIEVPQGPLTAKPEYASHQLQQILEHKKTTSSEVRPANSSGGYELEYLSTPSQDSGDSLNFLNQKPIREAHMEIWVWGLTRCKLLTLGFWVVTAHIWLFRMSAEWFCRSNQLQSMANSNPAVLRTPPECRLVELCCVCVFTLAKTPLCHLHLYFYLQQNLETISSLENDCNCNSRSFFTSSQTHQK